MTRLLTAAAALVLLVAFVGCHCTTGECDCDPGNGPCCYGPTAISPMPATAHMLPGETMSPPMARADR